MTMKLGDVCIIKSNFPDADFWLQRKGSEETIGKPLKNFYEENIGVKVKEQYLDKIDPGFIYYYFLYLYQKGVFKPISHGSLGLKNITVGDIKSIPLNFK